MTREDAIDVLKHNYPSACFTDLCDAVELAIQALYAQSEIIRCKDCKYVWKEDGWDNLYCNRVKVSGSFAVDKDGFCAWAKMEEGE